MLATDTVPVSYVNYTCTIRDWIQEINGSQNDFYSELIGYEGDYVGNVTSAQHPYNNSKIYDYAYTNDMFNRLVVQNLFVGLSSLQKAHISLSLDKPNQ